MKKVVLGCFCAGMFSVCADDVPEDGMYIGIGVTTAPEKYDFNMQSVTINHPTRQYVDLPYSNSTRSYTGIFSVGYKICSPLFLAAEFSIALSKQSKNHSFHKDDIGCSPLEQNGIDLSLQRGNDLQFLFKIGKTISDVTSYAILGWHTRKCGFSLEYPLFPGGDDFRYANKNYEVHKSGFVYGLGFSYYAGKGFDVCIEYTGKRSGNVEKICPAAIGGADLDENYPRKYSVKNKTQETFSLIITKTFSLF